MTDVAQPMPVGKRIKRVIRDHPLVPLIVLLIVLVGVLEFMRPGIVNERWAGNTIRFAIPLAMLAACQTLTMLTGGIDLSAGTAATISAFVVATQTPIHGPWVAMLIALVPAMLIGVVNGVGVGVTRVHPLIMTLGTGLIGIGCLQVYQRTVIASGSQIPDFLAWLGTGRTGVCRIRLCCSCRSPC
jgi:ribose transport system permease protein